MVKKNENQIEYHMAQYNELVNRLQNQIVQLKQELIEKDITSMKKPIKQFYEDKKQ